MLQRLTVGEIFEKVGKTETREEVIKLLRAYDSSYTRKYLEFMFHPDTEPDFPGLPEFKQSLMPDGMSESNLYNEVRRLYIFNKKTNGGIKDIYKLRVLQSILSGLNKVDADFFTNLLQGKAAPENLTVDVVNEAFPGLIPVQESFRDKGPEEVVVVVDNEEKKVKRVREKKQSV